MQDEEHRLRERVRRAWPAGRAPTFESTWRAAEARQRRGRGRHAGVAVAAAVVVALGLGIYFRSPVPAPYIESAELLETTYWSAPSDVLLPERQFDIYQDMPVIFESTEPAGGALL